MSPSRRIPSRKTPLKDREAMLQIWDALSEESRKVLIYFAAQLAKSEGLPEGDEPAIGTGKR